nr:ATP-binding protein [Motiliproteus sediminis]
MQSVWLDDLEWQVHLLTDLGPLLRSQRSLVLFCLGGGLAFCLLALLLRERLLKNRLHAEADALRLRNEAQQRAIIGSTQVGLITLDQRGRVRSINPEAMTQFGVHGNLIEGRPVTALLATADGPESLRSFFNTLDADDAPRAVKAVEGRALRGDGSEFPALLSINPLAWEDGDGYLVTVVDISRRKRAEQALQRANDVLEQRVQERTAALREAQKELIQQSKLASLGTMSAAIAHELNQPLTAIQTSLSSTRLLLQRGAGEQVERQLERIAAMTERMATISGQLKVFAHKRVDRFEAVSARKVLKQVLELMQERLRSGRVSVLWQGEADLTLYADEPRVEQVLVNLVRNALDAMADNPGGQLTLRLEGTAGRGQIAIYDQGAGLSEEVLEHLFDPFFTTKDVGEGLGLGLSISYGIVRDLDGQIRAENHPQGACFTIDLPLYPAQSDLNGSDQ